jgi:hypothetical protein
MLERPALHGALVGMAAMLIYVGIGLGQPEPIAYRARAESAGRLDRRRRRVEAWNCEHCSEARPV